MTQACSKVVEYFKAVAPLIVTDDKLFDKLYIIMANTRLFYFSFVSKVTDENMSGFKVGIHIDAFVFNCFDRNYFHCIISARKLIIMIILHKSVHYKVNNYALILEHITTGTYLLQNVVWMTST